MPIYIGTGSTGDDSCREAGTKFLRIFSLEFLMSNIKHIVLFGAGKSATVLIDYLKEIATENVWKVTVADSNLETAKSKVGMHALAKAVSVNIKNANERRDLIEQADIVVSLMPPNLHYLIAIDCVDLKKNLLTASYVDEQIKILEPEIKKRNLFFLCEMGLDPGIDHMSAMQLFHRIKDQGGEVISFKSHCGGLVAPESDDNPWHYKISWNPRNIVLAGKSGAVYKENGEEVYVPYEELFDAGRAITIPGADTYAYYPNRDSLHYISLYDLHHVETFLRTTLRHPEFCFGWKNIIDLKLTDEEKVYRTDGMSYAQFFREHFEKHGFGEWLSNMLTTRLNYATEMMQKLMQLIEAEQEAAQEGVETDEEIMMIDEKGDLTTLDVDDVKDKAAESVAYKMHEANLSMKQLFYLGLDDRTLINKGLCSAADVLQIILEKKLSLQSRDKDMIVMMHDIDYRINNIQSNIKSTLAVKGTDNV